jgi:DNA-directed RNA polymerase beta subunit
MEVWALKGFGVAHILEEILTYKSDHLIARKKYLMLRYREKECLIMRTLQNLLSARSRTTIFGFRTEPFPCI